MEVGMFSWIASLFCGDHKKLINYNKPQINKTDLKRKLFTDGTVYLNIKNSSPHYTYSIHYSGNSSKINFFRSRRPCGLPKLIKQYPSLDAFYDEFGEALIGYEDNIWRC